jgi:hypothetical protein
VAEDDSPADEFTIAITLRKWPEGKIEKGLRKAEESIFIETLASSWSITTH